MVYLGAFFCQIFQHLPAAWPPSPRIRENDVFIKEFGRKGQAPATDAATSSAWRIWWSGGDWVFLRELTLTLW